MLFSTSSFTTEAGRSTTSPAATWLATVSGRSLIRLIGTSDCRAGAPPAKSNAQARELRPRAEISFRAPRFEWYKVDDGPLRIASPARTNAKDCDRQN